VAGANAARSTSTWPKIAMAMKASMKPITSDWMIMVPSENRPHSHSSNNGRIRFTESPNNLVSHSGNMGISVDRDSPLRWRVVVGRAAQS
jgi:hypothetical protein